MTDHAVSAGFVGIPLWLGCLALVAFGATVISVVLMGLYAMRRSAQADLPNVLLGISHVTAAFSGMLPWGRPATPPPLIEPSAAPVPMEAETFADSVVLVRDTRVLRSRGPQGGSQ
jgi:Na+/proline symporter